jgi:MerR family copper efflux transcriptional regulator
MLRYIEQVGLVEPARSGSGYRLYGAPELQRLRTLRELLDSRDVGLGELAFVARMRDDADLRAGVDEWFESEARRPADVAPSDWLRFEQDKHERLLSAAAQLI